MAFNIVQFFENLFHITPAPVGGAVQSAVDTAGKALDEAENIVNTLQGLTSALPAPFQGYLAAFALAVHSLDSYVDTLESPAVTGSTTPQASTASPANLG